MTEEQPKQTPQLNNVLREGIAVVQMIFFKELRLILSSENSDADPPNVSMLAGAVTNVLFGVENPEPKFMAFKKANKGRIEQVLLGIKETMREFCPLLSDALRVQTLCDQQEGSDTTTTLLRAKDLGILIEERDIPLPSAFMTLVREAGKAHNLIVPPIQPPIEPDNSKIH